MERQHGPIAAIITNSSVASDHRTKAAESWKDRLMITPSTTISDTAKMMEQPGVVGLLVEYDGVATYSVTRHDLLRARLGLGVGWGIDL